MKRSSSVIADINSIDGDCSNDDILVDHLGVHSVFFIATVRSCASSGPLFVCHMLA